MEQRGSSGLGRLRGPAVLLLVPLVAFVGVVGITLAFQEGEAQIDLAVISSPTPTLGPPPTLDIEVASANPLVRTEPTPALASTATPEPPLADRTTCGEIAGTDYRSPAERAWYLENCVSEEPAQGITVQQPAQPAPAGLFGTGDRLVIQRLSIDAPVNVRTVGPDGAMLNPAGAYDVVWYDFSAFRGLGGYPGSGGNAVLAGHVDYYSVGAAVFYQLRNIGEGDVIEYYRANGEYYRYVVEWVSDVDPNTNWASLVAAQRGRETMTLITCNGTFDYSARQYSHRRVVRAHREV